MPPGHGRVLPLESRRSRPISPAAQIHLLYEAVGQLDDLHEALTAIDASRPLTAHDWVIESIPFRMRLPEVEDGLAVFGDVNTAEWPDVHWALDLDQARSQVESSLEQLLVALAVLVEDDSPPDERAQWSRHFGRHSRAVLRGVDHLRRLVAAWHASADQD